jgi:hypothetical protein
MGFALWSWAALVAHFHMVMSASRRAAGMLSAISTSSYRPGKGRCDGEADARVGMLRYFDADCGSRRCRRRRRWSCMRDQEKLLSVVLVVASSLPDPLGARFTPHAERGEGAWATSQSMREVAPFCRFLESRWHRASQCRNVFFCQRWKVDSLVFHPSFEPDTANGTIGYMPGQHTSLTSTNA